jgi:Putative transposase
MRPRIPRRDVLPILPLVLSFPFELSLLAATKPEVLRALARIHAEELARHYKGAAKKRGEAGKLHTGAVTFVQRFGSSLNLHVHLHTCALDGVYVEADDFDAPRFVPSAPPSRAELYVLTERVALGVMTWLRKRGYAKDDDHASNDTPDRTFAEMLAQVATQRGTLENVKDDTGESEGPAEPAAPSCRRSRHAPWLQHAREPHHRCRG